MADNEFRTIQSLGRNELITELMENNKQSMDSTVKGVGDDAAVMDAGDSSKLLSSESFMEGVNFDLSYVPLHHLGYKIATAAVSDIYAMNGDPEAVLVNMAVPNKLSVDMLKEVYRGIGTAGSDYGFEIVGGDLTASHQTLSIDISCYGSANEDDITYRSGANEGDAICLTGDLGGAIAGLRILMREKEFWEEQDQQKSFEPDLDKYEYVVKRQLVPLARQDLIEKMRESNILPSSMIDVTQGLVTDVKHLAESSGLGAYLYQATLPISVKTRNVSDEMGEEVDRYALYGGEDYELLFTLPEDDVEELADEFEDFVVIGKMTQDKKVQMQQTEGGLVSFDES